MDLETPDNNVEQHQTVETWDHLSKTSLQRKLNFLNQDESLNARLPMTQILDGKN